jgi:hypothetical protein
MNKRQIKGFLLILFVPVVVFWSILGFYDLIVYGKDKTNGNFEEMVKELKESVKNDLART